MVKNKNDKIDKSKKCSGKLKTVSELIAAAILRLNGAIIPVLAK